MRLVEMQPIPAKIYNLSSPIEITSWKETLNGKPHGLWRWGSLQIRILAELDSQQPTKWCIVSYEGRLLLKHPVHMLC